MLVTGSCPQSGRRSSVKGSLGFLRTPPPHPKVLAPQSSDSLSERFSNILDNCQKKIKLFQGPSTLFNHIVTKARRKDKECSSAHEQKLYLEETVLERNAPETDLRQLVELPQGLGYEEWLASHTIEFFHHINLLYGTVCEFCTLSGCPDMTGPRLRQYLWFDEKGKKTRVAAPQYVDYVMTFTQNTVNDEAIFPTKFENDFPSSFESIVKKIHRLLFHVIAHLYHAHFREVLLLSCHAHLNCLFAHFVLFSETFCLIEDKETEVLQDLIQALKIRPSPEGPDVDSPPPGESPADGGHPDDPAPMVVTSEPRAANSDVCRISDVPMASATDGSPGGEHTDVTAAAPHITSISSSSSSPFKNPGGPLPGALP